MRNIMMHVPLIKNLCKREMGEGGREGGSRGMREQQEGRRREGDRGGRGSVSLHVSSDIHLYMCRGGGEGEDGGGGGRQ